jgi:hypothetical protein
MYTPANTKLYILFLQGFVALAERCLSGAEAVRASVGIALLQVELAGQALVASLALHVHFAQASRCFLGKLNV